MMHGSACGNVQVSVCMHNVRVRVHTLYTHTLCTHTHFVRFLKLGLCPTLFCQGPVFSSCHEEGLAPAVTLCGSSKHLSVADLTMLGHPGIVGPGQCDL